MSDEITPTGEPISLPTDAAAAQPSQMDLQNALKLIREVPPENEWTLEDLFMAEAVDG